MLRFPLVKLGIALIETLTVTAEFVVPLFQRAGAIVQRRLASVQSVYRSLEIVARAAHVGQDLVAFSSGLFLRLLSPLTRLAIGPFSGLLKDAFGFQRSLDPRIGPAAQEPHQGSPHGVLDSVELALSCRWRSSRLRTQRRVVRLVVGIGGRLVRHSQSTTADNSAPVAANALPAKSMGRHPARRVGRRRRRRPSRSRASSGDAPARS